MKKSEMNLNLKINKKYSGVPFHLFSGNSTLYIKQLLPYYRVQENLDHKQMYSDG